MLIGFKTELKLNNTQHTELIKHCGVSRHAWNWGLALTKQILDHNKTNPDSKIKFPTAIDLHKWLVALVKPECLWYYECSKSAPQEALRALRTSWDRCFQKIAGVPKFKKKGKGMLANHKLAKAISDMGFYEFRRQLTYNCQLYGSKLVVVDRWYPSSKTCSGCGAKKEILLLSEREFYCQHCNFKIDRDLNAAINLSLCVAIFPPKTASGVSKAVS